MRNKKAFSFDERKEAETIIATGFKGSIDHTKMYLLSKYFRETYNYGEIRLEKKLIEFCKKEDPNFNPIIESDAIRKWVKAGMNYSLRDISEISITKKELEFLKTINLHKERKVLFVALIISKAIKARSVRKKPKYTKSSTNYYIRYSNLQDIIRITGIKNISEIQVADIFHKHQKYLTFYNPQTELIRLDYAEHSGRPIYTVSNLDNLMEEYDEIFGKNKINCSMCGKEITRTSGRQKFCEICRIKARQEKQKLLMRKRRK